jgi:hypothetical protein
MTRNLAKTFPVAHNKPLKLCVFEPSRFVGTMSALRKQKRLPLLKVCFALLVVPVVLACIAPAAGAAREKPHPPPELRAGGRPAGAAACCDVARAGKMPGSDEARAALDEALAPFLQELWAHFEEPHRGLLARIAAGEAPGERDARPLRDLGPRRGYLREQDGRWVLASEALRRLLALQRGADPSSPGLLRRMKRFFGG